MSSSKIDSSDAFVLFADLQAGIADLPMTVPAERLEKGVRGLAKLTKLFDIPFIVTAVREGGVDATILPVIEEVLGPYPIHYRTTADSWENSEIRAAIEASGRKSLLIAGVATEVAVQLPAISFADNGFRTFLAVEACGGMSARTEDAAFRRIAQAGGSFVSVLTLAGELAGDFGTPIAQQAVGVLFEMALG